MPQALRSSDYVIECSADVDCVEFSPFEWSQSVLVFVSGNVVYVYSCKFVTEAKDDPAPRCDFTRLSHFQHPARASSVSVSPETTVSVEPCLMRFCTSSSDGRVRVFTSDLKQDHEVKILVGHAGFVNCAAFDRDKGRRLASVGDDCTCRLWDCSDGQELCIFPLRSAGISVLFHSSDSSKMLVGEKNGTIRLYNVVSLLPVMSITSSAASPAPLRSVAWHPLDQTQVFALAGQQWMAFDVSRSSFPYLQDDVGDVTVGKLITCAATRYKKVAIISGWGVHLRVLAADAKGKQPLIEFQASIGDGASWHCCQPVLAVGGDKKVHLFFVN